MTGLSAAQPDKAQLRVLRRLAKGPVHMDTMTISEAFGLWGLGLAVPDGCDMMNITPAGRAALKERDGG